MKYLVFVFLCSFSLYIAAQTTASSSLFERGKELFDQGHFASASRVLKEFAQQERMIPYYKEETDYMLACSAYELKEPDRLELLRHFLERYPHSPRINRVYALMGSACFFEKEYVEAIALFGRCRFTLLSEEERDASAFRLGCSYLETGNLDEASVWFRTLEEISPAYRADAVYRLSYIDYLQGRYEASLPGFLSLQDNPAYAETVPYYIAEIYLLKKNFDKSEIVAQNYLSAYPGNSHVPDMQRILGESEFGLGHYSKAIGPLEDYVQSTPSPRRSVLYKLGMSYYYTNVFSQAAVLLERTTGINDALAQHAWLHMGLAYLQLKDKAKARMAFSRAASSDYDAGVKEQALYDYALCIHETAYSPFDESVSVFERFLNEFPRSAYREKVSEYLVEVYLNTRSYEAALKSIGKIADPAPRILQAKQKILFRLGTQAFADSRFGEAAGYLNRSLELSRYDRQTKAEACYWLGETDYRLNRYADANRNFQLYLEYTSDKTSPVYAMALYNLGYTAFKQKSYSTALSWFQKYVRSPQTGRPEMLADAFNRIGDCYFHDRNFKDASHYYLKSIETDASMGDYSLFQAALVGGLQKDYSGKTALLDQLLSRYPRSPYAGEALYEKGRAYVQLEENARAIETFGKLLAGYPESPAARKGANEIGLLYYQNEDYSRAIEAYKKVMISYPGSEEAQLAQRDLKSIYLDLNKIDEYADFLSKIPGNYRFDDNERDSLTYVAAEKVYMRGDRDAARAGFERYLQLFPQGTFSTQAHYYLGQADYRAGSYADALKHLEKVTGLPDTKFAEDALAMSAEIRYGMKNYKEAFELYKRLKEKTSSAGKRQSAMAGMLRSARMAEDVPETVRAASELLDDPKLSPELENEARYDRSKAWFSQGKPENALPDLKELSRDTRTAYGAEAAYLLAQYYFDSGQTALAEKEVLDYIDKSTPHAYWLARSFLLLSDIYLKMGRKSDARQYLISLQENYRASDDIAGRIDSRLKKLTK